MIARIITVGLLAAVPALAQQQQAPAPTPSASAAQPEKPVCRREQQTGSMLPGKKTCHTRAEWAAIDSTNSSNAENALSRRANTISRR